MRSVSVALAVVLLLALGTVIVAGARQCDMAVDPGGMTIRIRATGEDITGKAGAYARSCLQRAFFTSEAPPGATCENRAGRLKAALDL